MISNQLLEEENERLKDENEELKTEKEMEIARLTNESMNWREKRKI